MYRFFIFLKKISILFLLVWNTCFNPMLLAQNESPSNEKSLLDKESSQSTILKDFSFGADTVVLRAKINEMTQISSHYETLISDYSLKEQYSTAIYYQEKLINIQDSIAMLEKIVALTGLQLQFEAEQSKNEISLMNARNDAQMAFMKRQEIQSYGFLAGGIFLFLFVIGLFSRLRFLRKAKIKMEEQQKRIANEKQRAEESEKIREQFLSKMSHEIRTPLSSIMGMSHILNKNEHLWEQEKYLDAIWQSSENLLVILNDILDLSRLESGKIEIEKIPFQPINELMKLRELLKYKAEEKGIDLLCDLHPDIPKVLVGDPVRLNQVLLNLTGNAIKFTEKGKIRVSIRLKEFIENKAIIECTVLDTGIGIPKDRLDKIFDSFTQADSDTSRKYGGTGLGLTISKQLLELQNGSISVESNPGEGSTFTFRIPFEIGEENKTEVQDAPVAEKKLKDLKILLVEDNEFNIMVVTEELKGFVERVQIDVAENGKEAVNKVLSTDYDLILMDIEMLEMNGYEAARAIRVMEAPKNKVPIIAMTANAMKGEIQKCFDAGMNEFISKPFDPEDLKSKVHNLVGKEID